jgi:autotransporter-associated beta strand protein
MTRRTLSVAAVASVFATLAGNGVNASAGTDFWDGGSIDLTGAGDGSSTGGAGTWDTATRNWDAGAGLPYVTWDNSQNLTAAFGGTAGTVSLGANITAGGLQFNTTGYTISTGANTLTFGAANNTITLNNIAQATITGAVSGTGNMTFLASNPATAGTVTFNGTSAGGWSGTTTAGSSTTLEVGASSQALLNTSGITISGGSIKLTNTNSTEGAINRLNNAAPITSYGGTFTYNNTTANTYAESIGVIDLVSGQLNLVEAAALSSGSQTLTIAGLTRSGSTSAISFSAPSTGPQASGNKNMFVVSGAGTTTAGQIIGPWATTGTTAALQSDYAVYSANFVIPANIAASAETTWTSSTQAYTSSGAAVALSGNRVMNALKNTGATATITLSDGANGYSLATNGVLNAATTLLTIAPGSVAGSVTAPGTSGGQIYINTGSAAITVSAPINDNGGAVTLVKTGSAGTLTLSSTTSNYSGGTVLNAGTLATTDDTNLGTGGGVTFSGNATWNLGAATSVTYNRSLTINDGAVANFVSGNAVKIITGVVSGNGALVWSVTTGLQLSNTNNTFNGPITVTTGGTNPYGFEPSSLGDDPGAGQVNLGGAGNTGYFWWRGTAKTFANRQFALSGTTGGGSIGNLASSGALTISKDLLVTAAGSKTLTLSGTNTDSNTFAGNITDGSGTVSLAKGSSGLWALSGTNTYSGATVNGFNNPAGAGLVFQGMQALSPNTTLSQTHAGGVGGFGPFKLLDDAASPASRSSVNLSMTASNTSNTLTLFVGNNSASNGGTSSATTTGSTITLGNLTFTQTVAGNTVQTLAITGANSYRLQINNVTLPAMVATTASWSGTFTPTTAPITIAGNVIQAAGNASGVSATLTLDGTASSSQITGNIQDATDALTTGKPLKVSKTNSGVWTLSGNNSFSGGLTLSGATAGSQLNINSATALGTGTFTINGGNNAKFDNTSGSALTLSTNNALSWSNDFAFVGSNSLNLGTGNVTLGGNRNLTISGSTLTVGGVISGGFGITKSGVGTLSLSGANAYTGTTTVSAGKLLVNNPVNATDSGTGTGILSITGTLGGSGQIAPGSANAVTVNNNGVIAPGNSIGTLTINSANTTAASVLTFAAGGKLLMELGSGLQSDSIAIASAGAGDVTFNNTVVNFSDLTSGSLTNGQYTLFTADASGAYSGLTTAGDGTITGGLTIGTGLTSYSGSTLQLSGNNIVLNVVPEPGSAALAALAAVGLLSRRKRRRLSKQSL